MRAFGVVELQGAGDRVQDAVRDAGHLNGGPAPVRAYVGELLPAVLDGTVNPGKVFDRTVTIDEVPAAYRAMDDRAALKVLISF
ncbi:hypothetical protein ACTOB_004731 [Actinoplanes oblitus]|uniref:Uncharacterized protein n=1 Tax=Actinoplanes oblitus TaxID=3040509 RepID=A0ABY8W6J5_9ACTN|nr:hypothetical protein [Actinoplanes oblitus]WIM92776.1 hypothetical protein ACTOB_004731 [Actinoplanes oblitus]